MGQFCATPLAGDADGRDRGPRRFRNPHDGCWHTQIMQGEAYVTGDTDEVLTTILGSCVAACIRDPVLRLGGMNHFLLPEADIHGHDGRDGGGMRYGVYAMEKLINGILSRGGVRERLQAKLFGGANVMAALSDVGTRNADFAERFLQNEGIAIVGGDLRGISPRRIQYWPASGRARQLAIVTDASKLVQDEMREAHAEQRKSEKENDVELF
ncbi:MAG: chemotaxis protein CheD [Pseudomonadota bacterium]|nr:chemotaxis protein CheD [Pseudomonadota bacterium]